MALCALMVLGCFSTRAALAQSVNDLLRPLPARELGPTTMSGRITNFGVYEAEPRIYYVGTASGGVWKTENGGITMKPVFQYEHLSAIGDVAVNQKNPNDVWVGTGEENSRNSTSWGNGIYHSTDGGKSWQHMGLEKTRHISTILLDPKNPNTIYVGALGHLWGTNPDRGVYKSTDGGKTWNKILFVNDKTGIIEMIMDPRDPNVIYAAAWERFRWPYRWASGGPSSALYKTTDGGKNWTKLTEGIPKGDIGRIGLSLMASKPDVLVATFEHATEGGVYKSSNAGKSWTKLNSINPRPFYFSVPRIDPVDENRIYLPAVNFHYSTDGGKTFGVLQANIHVDYHAMWINPKDNNHMIVGEDGGVGQTRDRGVTWEMIDSLPVAQFYAVAADMRKPYWVYGGLQDNGSWGGPTQTRFGFVGRHDWRFINGGDGFHVQVDPTDWRIVYAESQGGAVARHNIETGERVSIRPRAPQGETYRFNWSSPIVLSPHNPHTVWFGGNKLFKSVDRGDNWIVASPDLTTNDPDKQNSRAGVTPEDTGAERHSTIITISESERKAGVVWVGTDDGQIQLTQDDGKTWTNVTDNLPAEVPDFTWVSRVTASRYELGRAYVTLDGHRFNDYNPYVYVTEDFGKSWKKITTGLSEDDSAYVITEGRKNPNLLVLGTERGMYFSLDRGGSWTRFQKDNGFPTVRVDDLLIHPRDLDLIVGTHGRSIWIVPIAALESLTDENLAKDMFICPPKTMYGLGRTFGSWFEGDRHWKSPNTEPNGDIYFYLKEDASDRAQVTIQDASGNQLGQLTADGKKGLNRVSWRPNARTNLQNGEYIVILKVGDKETRGTIRFEDVSSTMP